jgi:predicted metalloendopeptidase
MRHLVLRSLGGFLVVATAACGGGGSKSPETTLPPVAAELPEDRAPAPTPAPVAHNSRPRKAVSLADVGLDPANLDKNVDACEDFYQFACGGWLAANEMPADRSRHGNFSKLGDQVRAQVREILEDAAKNPADDPAKKKIGDYYASCMDEASIERLGVKPVQPLLAKVRAVTNAKTLSAAITELQLGGVSSVFRFEAGQDDANATQVIGILDQGGLGLPNREYYVSEEPRYQEMRKKYEEHVARTLQLGGSPPATAKKQAAQVMKVETALAQLHKTPVERRDPKAMYNKIDREGVSKVAPAFDWDGYFKAMGAPELKDINVTSPKYLEGFSGLMGTIPLDAWRAYLTYHVFRDLSLGLPKRFVAEGFAARALVTGQPKIEERWERCSNDTVAALAHLVAQPFVAKYYGPDSEKATTEMVHGIREAMRQALNGLPWMDAKTRARALAKLEKMSFQMGYPKKWRTYEFAVNRKTYLANNFAAERHDRARTAAKIGKPVDRDDWELPPPIVNAFYNANLNTMFFPAGILAPPFLNPKASVAVNLGAIGMVVGHELTHGFDDQGAQFDGDGNLKNWWEPQVGEEFKRRTKCVSNQYAQYEVEGQKVNGDLTLGENVADIGGLKMAFAAYRAMRANAKEELVADGYTEDQQFFLAQAQVWCSKDRPESAKQRLVTDPHSPPRFRVNGTMQATPAFQQAFQCKAGQGMAPKTRCEVW